MVKHFSQSQNVLHRMRWGNILANHKSPAIECESVSTLSSLSVVNSSVYTRNPKLGGSESKIKDWFNEAQTHGHKLYELFQENKSDSLKKLKNDMETILQSLEGASYLTAKTVIGIYALPSLLIEPLDYFVEVIPDDVEYTFQYVAPKIISIGAVTEENFYIVAENEMLFQTKDLKTAVGLLFSLCYTVNISYPKEIACMLIFLQKYFLKIDCGTVPHKVITLHHRLSLK